MREVELDGFKYRTGALNAFEQYHVFRKLAPLFSGMGESFTQLPAMPRGENGELSEQIPPGFWQALAPVAEALSKMSMEDSEYVLGTCLKTCTRLNEMGQWARVAAPNGQPMFDDIGLMTMLNLCYEVVNDNLGNFFGVGTPNGSGQGVSLSPLNMPR